MRRSTDNSLQTLTEYLSCNQSYVMYRLSHARLTISLGLVYRLQRSERVIYLYTNLLLCFVCLIPGLGASLLLKADLNFSICSKDSFL